MNLAYFEQAVPVTNSIFSIITAAGWALLLGNLVFQATKSMAAGLGFEGEDPKLLFTRTFVFGFLLLSSRQVCAIGLDISARVIRLLRIPSQMTITVPDETYFELGASWLLAVIIGLIIMWQFVKLFFEIAERYVVTNVLVILAPLAFSMGGSKNTADIFKGWCRMFASMCTMMVMNVVFLKLLLSAMGRMPSGEGVLPWMLLIVGIARTARKIDSIIARTGLSTAMTGEGLGRGLPGMMALAVMRSLGSTVSKTVGQGKQQTQNGRRSGGSPGGRNRPHTPPPSGGGGSDGRAGGQRGRASNGQTQGNGSGQSSKQSRAGNQQRGGSSQRRKDGQGTPPVPEEQGTGRQQHGSQPMSGKGAQRTDSRSTRRTAVSTEATARSASPAAPSNGSRVGQPKGPDTPQRPPVTRMQGTRPEHGGTRSASYTSQTASVQNETAVSSTQSNTQEHVRESKPIRQDGTAKISTPPGVGAAGKRNQPTSASAGMRRSSVPSQTPVSGTMPPTGTVGARKTSAPNQPPVSSTTPPSGTAGTRKTSAPNQPPASGTTPPSGTAGTRKTSAPSQPPVSGSIPPTGTAGTREPSAPRQPLVSGSIPPTGTAGTRKTSVPNQPPVSDTMPPTSIAGTRKTSAPSQPLVSGTTPPTSTAGTRKTSMPNQPPINQGPQPEITGHTTQDKPFRRKGGKKRG